MKRYRLFHRFTFVLPNIATFNTIPYYFHVTIAIWLTYNVAWNYFRTVLTPPGQPKDERDVSPPVCT